MLALLGFMLAVSLSMADSNFQARHRLVLDEANAIWTSSLRASAIGGPRGAEIARLPSDYTQLRLDFFAAGNDQKRLKTIYSTTSALQKRIWDHASSISQTSPTPISALLLASLNQVFDLGTARRWVLEVRIPPYIINPDHALGFTGIGLPVENTLISLRRLHSLAFGFETFAFWQKTELSRLSTVFQGNPIPVLTKYLGSKYWSVSLFCRWA